MTASVAYRSVLDVRRETVVFLSALLHAERRNRGTRAGTRAIGCFAHAVLVLRWFLDGTRAAQLARDNTIASSTAYRYLHEGITVLAARKPSLHTALLAAKMAGHSHINLDGTLIYTDRCKSPDPPQTAGRCGPPTCDPAANMTPPACGYPYQRHGRRVCPRHCRRRGQPSLDLLPLRQRGRPDH